jgi:alpha-D-ribose 1-methylphosphonate 5-triphosphate synthase subunit PhnH
MSAALADVGSGLRDAVHGAQACFRTALQALSNPGRICALPWVATAGLQVPSARDGHAPMAEATAALLLTLLDAECTLRLHGSLASDTAQAWLRFHTGARQALPGESAAFTVVRAADMTPPQWEAIDLGGDEAPQRGGTLIVEVPALAGADDELQRIATTSARTTLRLRGPGIEDERNLAVSHVPESFWHYRIGLSPHFPQGFELFLTNGRCVAALPRSTRIAVSG